MKKLSEYEHSNSKSGKPKNDSLMRSIEDIRIAVVDSLWTDKHSLMPTNAKDWCEVWIRVSENDFKTLAELKKKFYQLLDTLGIEHSDSCIKFPERAVFLVNADINDLISLLNSSDNIAEFRATHPTAEFFSNTLSAYEQREWIEELKSRLDIDENTNITVCVLDTGVNDGHPLLKDVLSGGHHTLTVNRAWGTADVAGHGTDMCGVAAFGDLTEPLSSTFSLKIGHKICSVKLLRREGENGKDELRAELTQQAVAISEIENPKENEIFCMAVTAQESDGTPSSWSAAVDQLAYGEAVDNKRLMIISAGNIDKENYDGFPELNDTYAIQDPAQAWNALTIGACTFKDGSSSSEMIGKHIMALPGSISPYSTTSLLWKENRHTPLKPELMFEGGNRYVVTEDPHEDSGNEALEVLTTRHDFNIRGYFETMSGTSSATALASNLAAKIQSKYPDLWPESVRGLMVNSARWSDSMQRMYPVLSKNDVENRIRHCGYGIPDEDRSLNSYGNGLTYIIQDTLKPLRLDKSDVKPNEMLLYSLPWPSNLLLAMGEAEVTLRITLSYFIEPSPGKIGWSNKYRYPSFGLRYDVNRPTESRSEFLSRINKQADKNDPDTDVTEIHDDLNWTLGTKLRSRGSLHTDKLTTTASDLASCNYIAVYPTSGWWRYRKFLNRYNNHVRFALIISLDTPAENVNLYNEIITKIKAVVKTSV